MDKLRNAMIAAWIICLILLGIVAHLANESIEGQMVEEERRRSGDR